MISAALYAGRIVVGSCLLAAGLGKWLFPLQDEDRSVLTVALERRGLDESYAVAVARTLWRALAVLDLGLAGLLVIGVAQLAVGVVSFVYMMGALAYLTVTRRSAGPAATCNCFGMTATVGNAALTRAGVLGLAAAGYAVGGLGASGADGSGSVQYAAMAAEFIVVVICSPELALLFARLWRGRRPLRLPTANLSMWASGIAAELEASQFWAEVVAPIARAAQVERADAWHEAGWHFFEYVIRGERTITVVAGCRGNSVPAWHRFVLIREDVWTGEVVRSWDSAVAADLQRARRATPPRPSLAHAAGAA